MNCGFGPSSRRAVAWAAAAGTVLMAACASGPAFVAAEGAGPGEAVVYLYRTFTLHGIAIQRDVRFRGLPSGQLPVRGYLRLTPRGDEGPLELQVQGCEPLGRPFTLRVGDVVYVEAQTLARTREIAGRYYFDHTCRLRLRTAAEALPELASLARAD